MDPARLRELLASVQAGATDVESALDQLRDLPFADLGFATVDHHRALRQGVPEVVFGLGKTAGQIGAITRELASKGGNVLVTRLAREMVPEVQRQVPALRYAETCGVGTVEQAPIVPLGAGTVALVSAGTADMPVAEECAETMRMLGVRFERVFDVGVSGIHRLLAKRDVLGRACIVIVVAGMEGALPSVVGGLVDVPVVAVPVSAGYGASLGGFTALASMLTSCASGITVCNIDNGFGAAFAAARILRAQEHG